jgi:hypothetical protein
MRAALLMVIAGGNIQQKPTKRENTPPFASSSPHR